MNIDLNPIFHDEARATAHMEAGHGRDGVFCPLCGSIKIAQERLGHATVAITLDLYSHVLPGMQADAALRVDEALRLELEKRLGGAKG